MASIEGIYKDLGVVHDENNCNICQKVDPKTRKELTKAIKLVVERYGSVLRKLAKT